jgi:hypothetical protein
LAAPRPHYPLVYSAGITSHIRKYSAMPGTPIPIWVAGQWPNRAPLRRAARWDGVFPIKARADDSGTLTPDEVRELVAYIRSHRESAAPFDVVIYGATPADDPARAAALVAPYAEAGLTWWQESLSGFRGPVELTRARIRQGPPRPS